MKRTIIRRAILSVALLALVAVAAGAETLTVGSILAAHEAGATSDGIIAMVRNPSNTVAMTAGDLATLHDAGVGENVIIVIWAFIPEPAQTQLEPDDARLVDLVRLIRSGMSESIIAEQVKQSGNAYNLSVNDLLYLKANGAGESTIAALMATPDDAPAVLAAAPASLALHDLVLMNRGLWRRDREGHLLLEGDTLRWEDKGSRGKSFSFQTQGLERVWFTCEARSSGNFCYQINFQIVKGDRYRFRDSDSDSGSNDAVLEVMEALRTYFPRLPFGKPSVKN
jgi:hypothetical protein